jgi:hypothetical protein
VGDVTFSGSADINYGRDTIVFEQMNGMAETILKVVIKIDGSFFPTGTLMPLSTYKTYAVSIDKDNANIMPTDILPETNFFSYYVKNGKKAGKYTFDGNKWGYTEK